MAFLDPMIATGNDPSVRRVLTPCYETPPEAVTSQ